MLMHRANIGKHTMLLCHEDGMCNMAEGLSLRIKLCEGAHQISALCIITLVHSHHANYTHIQHTSIMSAYKAMTSSIAACAAALLPEANLGYTCNGGARVLQQLINQLQTLVALIDGALYVELVHHQWLTSSPCQSQYCLHLCSTNSST